MTDEGRLRERQDDGEWARALKEDPRFQGLCETLRTQLFQAIEQSDVDDDQERRNARIALGVVSNLRQGLDRMISDGGQAHKRLLEMDSKR